MLAVRTYSKTFTHNGYKINLRLFEYGDGSNKVERWVYGPDGYYRANMSYDVRNVSESECRKIRGEA